jgi:hypothetical protein
MGSGRQGAVHLRAAMALGQLSLPELWLRYFALGGTATESEVRAHVDGEHEGAFDADGDVQHDTLVQALNERFMELDLHEPLPYERG